MRREVIHIRANQVEHFDIRMPFAVPKRQSGHRPDMLLKLVHRAAVLRPMAGVMHAGRNLVDDETAGRDEQFNTHDADIVERVQDACGQEHGV